MRSHLIVVDRQGGVWAGPIFAIIVNVSLVTINVGRKIQDGGVKKEGVEQRERGGEGESVGE